MTSSVSVLKEAFRRGRLRPLEDYSKESIKQYVNPTQEKIQELKEKCDILVGKYHKWTRLYVLTPNGEVVQLLPYLFVGKASRVANLVTKEVQQKLNINNKARVACYDFFKRYSDGICLEHLLTDILEESRAPRRNIIQTSKNNKIDFLGFIPNFDTPIPTPEPAQKPPTKEIIDVETFQFQSPIPTAKRSSPVQNPIQFTRPVQKPVMVAEQAKIPRVANVPKKVIPYPKRAERPTIVPATKNIQNSSLARGIISVPVFPYAPYKPSKPCKFKGSYIVVPNRREVQPNPNPSILVARESKRKALEYFTRPISKRRKRI